MDNEYYRVEFLFKPDEFKELIRYQIKQEDRFYKEDLLYSHEIAIDEDDNWILIFYIEAN